MLDHAPERLIGDRAYDSDPLDERLRTERGIEMIARHTTRRPNPWSNGKMSQRISHIVGPGLGARFPGGAVAPTQRKAKIVAAAATVVEQAELAVEEAKVHEKPNGR